MQPRLALALALRKHLSLYCLLLCPRKGDSKVCVNEGSLTEPGCLQVGSVEGRVAVQHVEDSMQSKNFTFKCHRDGNDVYAVNSIVFHPQCVTVTHTHPHSQKVLSYTSLVAARQRFFSVSRI